MRLLLKILFALMTTIVILVIYWYDDINNTLLMYTSGTPNIRNRYGTPRRRIYTYHRKDVYYLIYWTPLSSYKDFKYGYGFDPFKNCDYKNCYATANKSFLPVEKFDAFLFQAQKFDKKKSGIPKVRKKHQVYIYFNHEAPVNWCPDLKQQASFFNWTMTYRFDSDVFRPYGYVFKIKTNYTLPTQEFFNNKTKLAAWFVSNCKSRSERGILGKEIQKFIPVDVYGTCGPLKCKRSKTDSKLCYDMVEKDYKFYFAFENSYCKDYVTEKLYNLLQRNIVPIVYSAADYKKVAPPNSVINIEDFETIEEFANYLKHLDKNNEEYLKYFRWKTDYRVSTSPLPSACDICERLNKPLQEKNYHDLHTWWWGPNKSFCKMGKNLPHQVSDLL